MGWRASLETLQKQFEIRAGNSRGLHHLMVEVGDDEPDRMSGPDWFVRDARFNSSSSAPFDCGDLWYVVQMSTLPGVHPYFRELRPEEALDGVPQDRIIRDRSGAPRA